MLRGQLPAHLRVRHGHHVLRQHVIADGALFRGASAVAKNLRITIEIHQPIVGLAGRHLLGLPLLYAISARGWWPEDHADFLHFFFDSGNGSSIAFFYYIGTSPPEFVKVRNDYRYRATHTAWRVESREALLACRAQVEAAGIKVKYQIRHEVIESIYFEDPNGYSVEVTWQVRPFTEVDRNDRAHDRRTPCRLVPGTVRTDPAGCPAPGA